MSFTFSGEPRDVNEGRTMRPSIRVEGYIDEDFEDADISATITLLDTHGNAVPMDYQCRGNTASGEYISRHEPDLMEFRWSHIKCPREGRYYMRVTVQAMNPSRGIFQTIGTGRSQRFTVY
jgi:hypothetical protein